MKNRVDLMFLLGITIFLILLAVKPAYAENISIQPDSASGRDAYVRQDLPDGNFGTADRLNIGPTGSGDRQRAILYFNLSDVPVGSTITYAEVQIYLNASQQATSWLINISRITEDWNEGEATWNSRVTSTSWTTAGVSNDGIVYSSVNVTDTVGWFNWTITNLTQYWENGTYQNYGFVMIGQEATSNDFKRIYSSDAITAELRPKLLINYTANVPPSITSIIDNSNLSIPTQVGSDVNFTIEWSDIDSPMARIYVCNTSSITSTGCADTTFCSTQNSSLDPVSCLYTALNSDPSFIFYYVLVCDNEGNCSSTSTAYNFSVNHYSNVTVISPNGGETINQSQGNYLIRFNISDADNDTITSNIYYSLTAGSMSNLIISNLNLTTNCTDIDSSRKTPNNCNYTWNTSGIYGTFFLDIVINDSLSTSLDSSNSSFRVVSIEDSIPPNITSVTITQNLSSGEIAFIISNISELNMYSAWFEITTPDNTKTNYTMQQQSGSIFNGSFETGVIGVWYVKVYANDSIGNNGNSSLINFNVSKPSTIPQNELYQTSALTNELISIRGEINATDILRGIYAYLNDSSHFTFITGYAKNQSLGNLSAGNSTYGLWLIISPQNTGRYNLTILWADKYSNAWLSNQINISIVSSTGNPITVSADAGGAYFQGNILLLRARLENQNGAGITGATATFTTYFPNGSIWLNTSSMTEENNGYYNYSTSLASAPIGVYNVQVTGTSGTSSSTAQTSFSVLDKSTSNLTLVKINSPPEVEGGNQYLADIIIKDKDGQFVNASEIKIRIFDSLSNLVVGPVDYTSQVSTGIYRYNYTTPSTPQGQWETVVNVTRGGVEYIDRQYWNLVGGPFDIRNIAVIDNTVSSLEITVITENTGGTVQDLILTWNLTRTDTDATLDSGSDTFAVNPKSTKIWTIYPTTSYLGNVKIRFLGYWSDTEKAGAFANFVTVSANATTTPSPAPSSGGGSGGGGGAGPGGAVAYPQPEKKLNVSALKFLDLKKEINVTTGIWQSVTVVVKNTGNFSLDNTILKLKDLPSDWYKIEPESIPVLKPEDVEIFKVSIRIPVTDIERYEFSYVATSSGVMIEERAVINVRAVVEKSALEKLRDEYLNELYSLQARVDNIQYTISKSSELNIDLSEVSLLAKLAEEKIEQTINQVKNLEFENVEENIAKIKDYINEAEDRLRTLKIAIIEKPPSLVRRYWVWIVTWILLLLLIIAIYFLYKRITMLRLFVPRVNKERVFSYPQGRIYRTETTDNTFHGRIKTLRKELDEKDRDKANAPNQNHQMMYLILIIGVMFFAYLYLKPSLIGYSVYPVSEKTTEFRARLIGDISDYSSHSIRGFAEEIECNNNNKAIFFIDAGLMKAYVGNGVDRYWCKPITEIDWELYHEFRVVVKDTSKTEFYVDDYKVCSLNAVPVKLLPEMINLERIETTN